MNGAGFPLRVAASPNGRLRPQLIPSFGCRYEVVVGHRQVVLVGHRRRVAEPGTDDVGRVLLFQLRWCRDSGFNRWFLSKFDWPRIAGPESPGPAWRWLCPVRIIGRIFGGYLSAIPAWTRPVPLHWIGPAMLPQAGVALAMAIVSVHALPEYSQLLPVVIASTVLFELLGPIATRFALGRAGRRPRELSN